jgi:HPt (histidine-containing phosphotransfer) domain-containing protein
MPGYDFAGRLQADAETLARCRDVLRSEPACAAGLNDLRFCAHKLAGAAGVFGYDAVSAAAAAVEEAVDDVLGGEASGDVARRLDALIACIEQENASPREPCWI